MKLLATLAFILAAPAAHALDYASVAENVAILYDAPSTKAKKLFVASRYWPVEQVVVLDTWVKVRDNAGGLAWIEKRALNKKRYVIVTGALASVRQAPDENAALVMQARQQVVLEWLEGTDTGWSKVRHQDGLIGYIKTTDVWGS